jgi:spore germination cell wall hydrolase CwlJ-like protein
LFSLTQTRGYPRALIGAAVSGVGLITLAAAICLTVGFMPAQAQKAQVAPITRLAIVAPIDAAMQQDGMMRAQDAAHAVTAIAGSRDLDCLATAVYYEARGESAAGQAAVAQVVLNRTRHPAFPKTICGVVYQRAGGGCQFSFTCNGAMRRAKEPGAWARARQVAARALGGYVMADVGLATNFHVARLGRVWGGGMIRISQVGGHVFYRMDGRGLRAAPELPRATFVQTAAPAAAAVDAALAIADAVAPEAPPAKPAATAAEPTAAPSAADAGKPTAASAS